MTIDIDLNSDHVSGFNIDFSRINQFGGLITYGGPNVIETSFIDKDNSPGGAQAFIGAGSNPGDGGGIFILKDWDAALTDGDYNTDGGTDQKFKDMYVRFRPEVDHKNWAKFVDFYDLSNKDFAIKMYRELSNVLVQRQADGLEYQSAYCFKKKVPASPNEYVLISADSIGLVIEEGFTPFFRFGVPVTADAASVGSPSVGPRVTKFKESEIVITCSIMSEIRNYASQDTFINDFGDVGTQGNMIANMDESNGFMPFQVMLKERYKFKHIRGGMSGGVYVDGVGTGVPEIINTENIETDESEIEAYTDDQYKRIRRQEVTGSVQFTGTSSGVNIGDKVKNLIIEGNSIPVDAVVLTLNQNIESGGTSITLGKP